MGRKIPWEEGGKRCPQLFTDSFSLGKYKSHGDGWCHMSVHNAVDHLIVHLRYLAASNIMKPL